MVILCGRMVYIKRIFGDFMWQDGIKRIYGDFMCQDGIKRIYGDFMWQDGIKCRKVITVNRIQLVIKGCGYDVQRHFKQYFSYIVAVSFIGGENHGPAASH